MKARQLIHRLDRNDLVLIVINMVALVNGSQEINVLPIVKPPGKAVVAIDG